MARRGQGLEISSFLLFKCISNVIRNTKTIILGSFWIENCIFKQKFQIWYISNKEPWVYPICWFALWTQTKQRKIKLKTPWTWVKNYTFSKTSDKSDRDCGILYETNLEAKNNSLYETELFGQLDWNWFTKRVEWAGRTIHHDNKLFFLVENWGLFKVKRIFQVEIWFECVST